MNEALERAEEHADVARALMDGSGVTTIEQHTALAQALATVALAMAIRDETETNEGAGS